MKQALKYTQNKDRTSNCVTIFHPIPYVYLSILSLSYLFDVHLCRKKVKESESVWEEQFQKRKGWGGKRDRERKSKRRGIKRKEE